MKKNDKKVAYKLNEWKLNGTWVIGVIVWLWKNVEEVKFEENVGIVVKAQN